MADMTDAEIIAEGKSGSLLKKARDAFSQEYATIEQAQMQRVPPRRFDYLRMEYAAAKRIAAVLGVTL